MSVTAWTRQLWMVPEIRGVGSLVTLKYATKAFALVRLAVITRWLSPADLGGFGLAILVFAVAEIVTETGVNMTLLKHPNRLKTYIHTAWVVSMVRGVLIAAAILALAVPLQQFFSVAELPFLLQLCALTAVIRGAINPAVITFQQELQFGRETLYRVPLQIIDLLVGFLFAWWWQSAAGLIVGLMVAAVVEVISSFMIFSQRPNLLLARWDQVKSLYRETRAIILNGIAHYLTEHSDDLLIGRLLGSSALGLYQTAYKIISAVTMDLAAVSVQALYPIYAKRLNSSEGIARTFWRSFATFLIAVVPFGVAFMIFPAQLTNLVFGAEWQGIAPILPWLFIGAVAKSSLTLATPIAILKNTVKWYALINFSIVVMMLAGITWLGPRYGVLGASWAVMIAMLAVQPVVWWSTLRAVRKA